MLAFTFLNSVGTGLVTAGIPFLATSAYRFTAVGNFFLGLIVGITYIAGALAVGPALRRLVARLPWLTSRTALLCLMTLLGALCVLPLLARRLSGSDDPSAGVWAVWVLIALYSPLTGVLWPIVEAFLSGGRSAQRLRSATGLFNVVWSSALVASYWGMSLLIEERPLELIAIMGAVHLVAGMLLVAFRPEPGRHVAETHEPHPPVYLDLLHVCRVLLPASYLVYSALTPYLPTALTLLKVPGAWQPLVASTWLVSRVLSFVVLQRWHGWHGRWSTPVVGGGLLLTGFSVAVLAPPLVGGAAGLCLMLAGLAGFGVGMGVIYAASLYYAMEVGEAKVDAGGVHEALIGVGYTAGPLCGLAAAGLVGGGWVAQDRFEFAMIGAVGLIMVLAAAYAARQVWRRRRRN